MPERGPSFSNDHDIGRTTERRDIRVREVMERRQRVVSALMDLEEVLSGADGRAEDRAAVVGRLPEAIRERAARCVETYARQRHTAKSDHAWIRRFARQQKIEENDEGLGRALFRASTGSDPRGRILLVQKEGYLLVAFDDQSDYQLAAHKYQDASRLTSGGTFHRTFDTWSSDQLIPSYARFPVVGVSPRYDVRNVLMVNGADTTFGYGSTVAHERQHFINHSLLGRFRDVERTATQKESLLERALYKAFSDQQRQETETQGFERSVKDEVLSFVRGGSFDVQTNLQNYLYRHLFDNKHAPRLRDYVADIARVLLSNKHVFESEQSHQALVFQLIDVPLPKMARWIESVGKYYASRIGTAYAGIFAVKELTSVFAVPHGFSDHLQKAVSAFGQLDHAIFRSPMPIEEAARGARSDIAASLDGLKRDGVRVPFVRLIGIHAASATSEVRKYAQAIADAALLVPRTDVEQYRRDRSHGRVQRRKGDAVTMPLEAALVGRGLSDVWSSVSAYGHQSQLEVSFYGQTVGGDRVAFVVSFA